jgi:zinc protease
VTIARCAWLAAFLSLATARAEVAHPLPVSDEVLPNGLRVILAPDQSVASVVVEVRYGTGAADEATAQAGFAHVLERLMFTGSVHVTDFDARIDAAGGWSSSVTTADHMSVFEQVPAGALGLALWLEAERMAGIPDAIDPARLATVRTAIAAEQRSAYDDHPSGLVGRAVQRALWALHPNQHLVLAESAGSAEAVARFARATLVPANATLVVAGRFDPADVAQQVRRYFGWIPSRPRHAASAPSIAPLDRAARLTVDDAIPKLVVAFRAPAPNAPDAIDLEVAGRILAGGRGSRLWQRLVGGRLASEVHVELIRQARGSELRIYATALAGVDPMLLPTPIDDELAQLRDHAASAEEVARAQTAIESELVTGLQGLTFRADMLAAWTAYTGRAEGLEPTRAGLHATTPASVMAAAQHWLPQTAAVTVIGMPKAKP